MMAVKFGPDGLIPVVAQDAASGRVLTVAYMNSEALERTRATGQAWYWSRSRARLWRKGESSGHTQTVEEMRIDCDDDALLLRVTQRGPACHTGRRSCFFRDLDGQALDDARAGEDILDELFALLERRRGEMPSGSYSAALLSAGRSRIAQKVREEAEELARADLEEDEHRVVEEAADLIYHAWLLLVERGIGLADVRAELQRRRHGD